MNVCGLSDYSYNDYPLIIKLCYKQDLVSFFVDLRCPHCRSCRLILAVVTTDHMTITHSFYFAKSSRPLGLQSCFIYMWEVRSTNVLETRNCSAHSESMTSHALGGQPAGTALYEAESIRRTLWPSSWNMTPYRKADSVCRCVFIWRTILPNFMPIRFETAVVSSTWK